MKIVKRVVLFNYIIFFVFNINKVLYSLPGMQSIQQPQAPNIPLQPAQMPVVSIPTPTTVPTIVQPFGGVTQPIGAIQQLQQPVIQPVPIPLMLQYSNEKMIKDALSECASPIIPIFGTTSADKSKYLIYEAIFKALTPSLFPQISFETKLKIQSGFLADLVDTVLKRTDATSQIDITIKNLTDINNLLVQSLTNIKQINNDLSKLVSTETNLWKDRFRNIYTDSTLKKDKLTAKIGLQTDFFQKLEEAQALSITQLNEKATRLLYMATTFLPKDIISSLRDDFIDSISRLVTSVQSGTNTQKSTVSKFLTNLSNIKSVFSTSELDKIKALVSLLSTPSTALTQPPLPIAGVIPGQPQNIISQPTATVPIQTQQPITPQLTKNIRPSQSTAPQQSSLTTALALLNGAVDVSEKTIDTCNTCIDTIKTLSQLADKQTLAKKIQEKINFVYDKRISLKTELLTKLSNLLDKASTIDLMKNFITQQKINTVKVAILLNNAYAEEKNFQKFATELKKVVDALSQDTASYEKNRFGDGIDSLFVSRKNNDVKNAGLDPINSFKNVLDAITVQTFTAKKIFPASVQNKILFYSKIINALLILLTQTQTKDLTTQLNFYRPALDALTSPDTDYEKNLFFEIVAQIYENRGNFTYNDLDTLKKFFDEIMSKPGLLSLAARTKMESDWINEINGALNITPKLDPITGDTKFYLEALIENYITVAEFNKNVTSVYPKIFSLFTSETPVKVINIFLVKLNELVLNRGKLDKQKLLNFLLIKKLTIDRTGINEISSMLPDKQKDTLKIWIATLQNELKSITTTLS